MRKQLVDRPIDVASQLDLDIDIQKWEKGTEATNNRSNLKETPVPASVAELGNLHGRRLRVKKPGHVDDGEVVALVVSDDDAVEDLLGPDVLLRDLTAAAVGESGRGGVRDLIPVDDLVVVTSLHCSACVCTSEFTRERCTNL